MNMNDFAHALNRGGIMQMQSQQQTNSQQTQQQQQQSGQSGMPLSFSQSGGPQQHGHPQHMAALQRMQQSQQGGPPQQQQQQPNFQSVSQQQQQQSQQRMGAAILPSGVRPVIGSMQHQGGAQSNPQRSPITLQQQQSSSLSSSSNPLSSSMNPPPGSSSSLGAPPGSGPLLGMHSGGGGGGFQSEILQSIMKQGGTGGGVYGGMPPSQQSGLGGLHDPSGGMAPRFDMSDFPALSDMTDANKIGPTGQQQQTTLAGQIALSQQQHQQQQQDSTFTIQNEDFPALGGGSSARRPPPSSVPTAASLLQQRAVGGAIGQQQTQPAGGVGAAPASVAQQQAAALNQTPTQPRQGMPRPNKAQTCDKYGLTGLLGVIRMTDPDLTTLALGTDLTTLGLNLNSSEVLYATFSAPCLDLPTRSDPDFVLPFAYYMQPPALKTSHLAKFTLETLFYIFYNMPKDTLQVYAAKELFKREWRYHKEMKLWFSRAANATVTAAAQATGTGDAKKDSLSVGGGVSGAAKDATSGVATKDAAGKDASVGGLSVGGGVGVVDSNTYLYFDINAWSSLKWEGPIQRMLDGLDMEGYEEDWTNSQRKANEGQRTEAP